MKIPIYQIDAFTDALFRGNPAAVCPLERWPDVTTLQSIAAENNLAETAFFVARGADYDLRWFTPVTEVDLCGHATLASAFVIFEHLDPRRQRVTFHTRSGSLTVTRREGQLVMDFPARPPRRCQAPPELLEGLGAAPLEVWQSRDLMAVFACESDVRALAPRMELLARLDALGVIATAPGDEVDFVSRFFAPRAGVPEDPVTGSAHCTLVPYWSERLARTRLDARQVSARGGELSCELAGDRVIMAGRAVQYLEGAIEV